jgi:tRNA uridine 5-carboxymethylaminomethyl modification enzyme
VRSAYAIEYDCLAPGQLRASLESKDICGLFFAGQINGSSGYEEAAAQGIIAGINASRGIAMLPPVVLGRAQAYIGVLIDDLVTKDNPEPYRMMTARAEYRLLLRQDNADLRLSELGLEIGLISGARHDRLLRKKQQIESELDRLSKTVVGASESVNIFLAEHGASTLQSGVTLAELLRRPELTYESLAAIDTGRQPLPQDVTEQVEIAIKYRGYIDRQLRQVEAAAKTENRRIPSGVDYGGISSLRLEARAKLSQLRPETLGQASRISGVTPADVAVLNIYIEKMGREQR